MTCIPACTEKTLERLVVVVRQAKPEKHAIHWLVDTEAVDLEAEAEDMEGDVEVALAVALEAEGIRAPAEQVFPAAAALDAAASLLRDRASSQPKAVPLACREEQPLLHCATSPIDSRYAARQNGITTYFSCCPRAARWSHQLQSSGL